MAQTRKYATLPDLDDAPDIYETTPDLIEDTSTLPEDASQDLDEDASGVDRRHVETYKARTRFEPSRVDARDVDFSDKLSKQQRSYRTSSSRRRRRLSGASRSAYGDSSDEDSEPVDHRLARLRQEIEDVKNQLIAADEEESDDDASTSRNEEQRVPTGDIETLSNMLDSLYAQRKNNVGAEAQYMKATQRFSQPKDGPASTPLTATENPPRDSFSENGSEERAQVLAKAADFDQRLQSIEKALGLDVVSAAESSDASQRPILPALAQLDRQMTALSASTNTDSLNAASLKMRQLGQEAERLKVASAAASGTQTPSGINGLGTTILDSDMREEATKIEALYGTLPTIESLSTSLPLVLERLRTLRLIHASAGDASSALDALGKRQAEQASEIAQWRESLQKIEAVLSEGQGVLTANVKLVGEWVKDVEGRVEKLAA